MSRIENAKKNVKYGYLSTFLTTILKFIARTVFIYTIGNTYLGISGLYSNILSLLSLAELGIGTAMNYSLYKPIAEKDKNKVKSIMNLYKNAYRIIAFIVLILGLIIVPFLPKIISGTGEITNHELITYYLIFLFNTVSTYFVSYKYSLSNAEQKNYIQKNINSLTVIITTIFQVIILVIFKSFLLYLITASVIELIQKFFANKYLNRRYKFLLEKDIKPLKIEEKNKILNNIKALMYNKIGEVVSMQTDNIIISSFISITMVGLVSNYTLVIFSVTQFINILFDSLVSSFGNLIATEGIDKQYKFFKIYRFIGFWFYGFASLAFIILLNPFIELWLGKGMMLNSNIIYILILDYYFKGHRIVVNNFKIAAGIFEDDKYLSIIRGIVNLVLSIFLVRIIGLIGVFIGTLLSSLVVSLIRPKIIYNKVFNLSVKYYYYDSAIYLTVLSVPLILLEIIRKLITLDSLESNFIILVLLVLLIPNIFFIIFFKNSKEFRYIIDLIYIKLRKGDNYDK